MNSKKQEKKKERRELILYKLCDYFLLPNQPQYELLVYDNHPF